MLKRDSNTDIFLWILWNVSEHLFWRMYAYGCFWSVFRKWLFRTFFLDIGYKSRNLVKFHFKIKKNNLVHMPSLNLTLTLSFEPKFPMFNNNGYDRKSNRLKFLGSLSYFSLINFLQYAIPWQFRTTSSSFGLVNILQRKLKLLVTSRLKSTRVLNSSVV